MWERRALRPRRLGALVAQVVAAAASLGRPARGGGGLEPVAGSAQAAESRVMKPKESGKVGLERRWGSPRPSGRARARARLRRPGGRSALPWVALFCCACSAPTAPPGPARSRASSSGPAPRSGRPAPRHDGALLCPPGHHLHHVLGPHRHRRALVRAERTQPRGDHHHAGSHCCVLLPLLAHRHPGPAEPPVRAAAEERDHLVRALPLGVTAAASAQVPQLSG